MRPAADYGGDESLDKVVVVLTPDPSVAPADINGIAEPVFVIGTNIEQNGQAMFGMDTAEGGVERHFADGNAHSAGALVAQSENPFAVTDHDAANLVIARVGKNLLDAGLVGIADEETARFSPDFAEALASSPTVGV